MRVTLAQIDRNISASGKNGSTTYTFVSLLLADGTYDKFKRPEDIGGIVLSRATMGMDAASRHSRMDVECELPEGALIKTVCKSVSGGSATAIEIIQNDLKADAKYIGSKKNGAAWDTVIEVDGKRITING